MPRNMLDLALANPGIAATLLYMVYAMAYSAVMARVNRQRRILIAATQRNARGLPNGAVMPVPYSPNWLIRVWPDQTIRAMLVCVVLADIGYIIWGLIHRAG